MTTSTMDVLHFQHTPFYCEENVYLLCKKLCSDGIAKAEGSDLFVVFISNEKKQACSISSSYVHFLVQVTGQSNSGIGNNSVALALCKLNAKEKHVKFLLILPIFISHLLCFLPSYIPLWNQKASKRADGVILWDYHVICIQIKQGNVPPLVWDVDSTLPFPSPLPLYVSETIRPSFQLFSDYNRQGTFFDRNASPGFYVSHDSSY
ncbi:hypothetical protein V8G54_029734 [Vigna mungo]|uniref:Protein N-terminal glutamine amidohydrolase n=1 Tax=Vigna mungo TaxID=3915 RepID=A0AAQ3MV80_VIGMU